MKALFPFLLIAFTVEVALAQQDSILLLKGKVLCNGRPVSYASLQLKGTSIGVSCNDAGEYEFRIPKSRERDTVIVRSLGYLTHKATVNRLKGNGDIRLKSQAIELKTVEVSDFSSARHLLLAVVERIPQNYHQQTATSTFFYRDWRAIDGELYLFDEAVMDVRRCPYSKYADKRGYRLDPSQREMESNIKNLLRHRLVVFDRKLLENKIIKPRGCDQMLTYSDNEDFFDPVATPQASYALASRKLREHKFEPIKTFENDGEVYYLVRSVGPCRTPKALVCYEYTIRRSDLALVKLVSAKQPHRHRAPTDPWVNWYFNSMSVEVDSSVYSYDLREGRYTLTRYFNFKKYRLESRNNGHNGESQHWHQCHDWILTDFSLNQKDSSEGQVPIYPQTIPDTFGISDFNNDFWGRYNTIPLDSIPLQLLKEKFHLP